MMRLISLSFCSSDPCSSPETQPPHEEKKPSLMSRIAQNMKTTCSCGKTKTKKRHRKEKQVQEPIMADSSKELALGELFAKSPSVLEDKRNCTTSDGEDRSACCVSFSGQYSNSSTVSLEELLNSSDLNASVETESGCYYSDSRDFSFSLEKLMRDDQKKVQVGFYSLTRSQGSRERKVSFRLPEVSDIIILNSPEENHHKE